MSVSIGPFFPNAGSGSAGTELLLHVDQASFKFADLLGHSDEERFLTPTNWSAAGLPVRSHVRRFDETSLLALSAAIGAHVPGTGPSPDELDQIASGPVRFEDHSETSSEDQATEPGREKLNYATWPGKALEADFPVAVIRSFSPVGEQSQVSGGVRDVPVRRPMMLAFEPSLSGAIRHTKPAATAELAAPAETPRSAQLMREVAQARHLANHSLQVAICALESGLRVIVKARGAEIEDPTELRRAVADMLAQHGHHYSEITVLGMSRQERSGGK